MNELFTRFTSLIIATVSLLTATGVFMHDMRVDKAISLKFEPGSRAVSPAAEDSTLRTKFAEFMQGDAHTHPDFKPGNSLMKGFTYPSPSIPPREREHINKNLLRHAEPRCRHAFDNHNLPIIAD